MSFREKVAWISVVTTILVWGAYFGFIAATGMHLPGPVYMTGFIGAAVVQTILMVVASIAIAVTAPRDASAGADERDREISRRSYAIAYPVLLVLVICVAASMHFGVKAVGMTYGIMGAIVLAEIVHYGAQIAGYRTGR